MSALTPITRLAPSPTGALHLGNARTFLVNWVLARRNGWRILLRIDDLEGPRIKPGADREAIEDLQWLGLDWDAEAPRPSTRLARHAEALKDLTGRGCVYPCICTRSEIERDAGPDIRHEPDGAVQYPGTCRGRFRSKEETLQSTGRAPAMRFHVPSRGVSFDDAFHGRITFSGGRDVGDFVVQKADGEFAYQLATVVDDADAGVTHVVRGDDLLASTFRQLLVYEALDMTRKTPHYMHIPLVVGPDGRKLAKRHGDTRLRQLRDEGVSAGQVRHLLATWSGWTPAGVETSVQEWVERFELDRLPRQAVVYDDVCDRPGPCAKLRGAS